MLENVGTPFSLVSLCSSLYIPCHACRVVVSDTWHQAVSCTLDSLHKHLESSSSWTLDISSRSLCPDTIHQKHRIVKIDCIDTEETSSTRHFSLCQRFIVSGLFSCWHNDIITCCQGTGQMVWFHNWRWWKFQCKLNFLVICTVDWLVRAYLPAIQLRFIGWNVQGLYPCVQ